MGRDAHIINSYKCWQCDALHIPGAVTYVEVCWSLHMECGKSVMDGNNDQDHPANPHEPVILCRNPVCFKKYASDVVDSLGSTEYFQANFEVENIPMPKEILC